MAFDVDAYWNGIVEEMGLEPAAKAAVLKGFKEKGIDKKLIETMMPVDDYKRESGRVKAREKEVETQAEKLQAKYQELVNQSLQNQAEVDKANKAVQDYVNAYGTLPDGSRPTVANMQATADDWLKREKSLKEEFENRLATQGNQFLSIMTDSLEAAGDYQQRFGEKLPVGELKKYAIDKGIPLTVAYEQFIQPKVNERQQKTFAEQLKAAREEGIMEGSKRSGMPIDTRPKEQSPFELNRMASVAKTTGQLSDLDRLSRFAEAYQGNTSGAPK